MFRAISLAVSCCALVATTHAQSFRPYTVEVIRDNVNVFSGPGATFYKTTPVPVGTKLQVYKKTGDGWLGVRPTERDFSWVEASLVRIANGVAEVLTENAVAWIGTNEIRPQNHKWQIRLKVGERLETRGRRRLQLLADDAPVDFVKVSPPSGEFRWVRQADVEELGKQQRSPVQFASHQSSSSSSERTPLKWRKARRSDPEQHRVAESPKPALAPPRREPPKTNQGGLLSDRSDSRTADPRIAEWNSRRLSLEVASMAAQPMDQWYFKPLRDQAVRIVQDDSSPLERGRARLLIERIDDFRSLQQRKLAGASSPEASAAQRVDVAGIDTRPTKKQEDDDLLDLADLTPPVLARQNKAVGSGVVELDTLEANSKSPYVATGWLAQVRSRRKGVPPYAIVDRDENILCFVTPVAGYDIHRHLQRQIGVIGRKGVHPTSGKPHALVRKVVRLDRQQAGSPRLSFSTGL